MVRVDYFADIRDRSVGMAPIEPERMSERVLRLKAELAEKETRISALEDENRWLRGEKKPTAKSLIASIAQRYHITISEILSDRRGPMHISIARQHAMWLLKHQTLLSLPAIGRLMRRDHTTILHGIRQHERRRHEMNRKGVENG